MNRKPIELTKNQTWTWFEQIKNYLKEIGEQELANKIYVQQLKLENELIKEWIVKYREDSGEGV